MWTKIKAWVSSLPGLMVAILGIAIAVLLLVAFGYCQGISHAKRVATQAVVKTSTDSAKVLVKQDEHLQVVYRTDTLRLHTTLVQWKHDTLDIHDTVSVVKYIADETAAFNTCTETVTSCQQLHMTDQAVIKQQDITIAGLKKLQPSTLSKIEHIVIAAAIGIGVGYVARQ